MKDMKASAEKLRAEADFAEQIARSATDQQKRELYERLAAHFRQLPVPEHVRDFVQSYVPTTRHRLG